MGDREVARSTVSRLELLAEHAANRRASGFSERCTKPGERPKADALVHGWRRRKGGRTSWLAAI
eukprot:4760558-Alexandrium_andersonii.AAC.1